MREVCVIRCHLISLKFSCEVNFCVAKCFKVYRIDVLTQSGTHCVVPWSFPMSPPFLLKAKGTVVRCHGKNGARHRCPGPLQGGHSGFDVKCLQNVEMFVGMASALQYGQTRCHDAMPHCTRTMLGGSLGPRERRIVRCHMVSHGVTV